MIKTFPFRLDIEKEYNNRMYSVNSNDLKTVKFTFVVTDNGIPLDLTGLTVRIAIRKPDKKAVWQDCTVTNAPKGEVEVILESQAYIKRGEHEAELMLYKGTDTVAITQKFYYRAAEGIMSDKSLKSETVLGPIDQKLAEVEETLNDIRVNGTGIDAQARQDIESVATQLAEKATKEDIERMGSATPKNVYLTLTALQSAFSTGTNGIHLVTEDGKWYYWNGTAWTAGGVYQAMGMPSNVLRLEDWSNDEPVVIDQNFYDDFNRENSDDTLGSDYIIHNDPKNSAVWGIIDNQAYSPNTTSGYLTAALYDIESINASVEAEIKMTGGSVNFPGLILNYVDSSNFLMFRGNNGTGINIIKKSNEAYTTLVQIPLTFATDQVIKFVFKRLGNLIELYVDGALLGSHTLSDDDHAKYVGTLHGMLSKHRESRFDNLKIIKLS